MKPFTKVISYFYSSYKRAAKDHLLCRNENKQKSIDVFINLNELYHNNLLPLYIIEY